MASIADVYVTLLPETGKIADGIKKALLSVDDDVRKAAGRWKKEIEEKLKGIEVKADLKVDTRQAKKEIEAATRDQEATVNADADTAKAEAKLKTVSRDREAKIKVKVDEQSLKKAGEKIAKSTGFGKGGGLPIPGARGSIPPALAVGAVEIAPNVVPLIGSMVQAVGQLSGALGLIPAVAGAAGLAIGSLKIATAGFGDAMKNLGDTEKFNESVAQLAPSMQTAARGIQALLPQITQLKMTVGQAFGEGFGDQVQKLGSTYLPIFTDIMSRMSQSAGVTLGGIAKQLQTPAMQQDIKTFGANASQAFSNLLQAATPLVQAFTDIATVGSSFLPQLSTTVAGLAKDFANFISEARESGKLAEWIQNGITAITQLKDIAVNVWDIFKGIFQAAGGGDFLQTILDITNTWSNWVNSIGGQNSLKQFFDDAKASWDEWWPIIQNTGVILYNAFLGVKEVVDQILPLIRQITDLLAQHAGFVQAVGVAFGAWKLASIVKDVEAIGTAILGLGAKGAIAGAEAGAGLRTGILAGFGGSLTIPIILAASVAAVGVGAQQWIDSGGDITLSRFGPRPGHTGVGSGLPGQLGVSTGQHPGQSSGSNRTSNPAYNDTGIPYVPDIYGQNLPPSPHPGVTQQTPVVAPSPNALPDVSQQQAPAITDYGPPAPSPGGGGGGGSDAPKPTPVAPPGMSYDYTGYGELNWEALAQLESGGNWQENTGNGFFGGLQFLQSTWDAYGGKQFADRADLATKEEQIKVATAVFNKAGPGQWPANGWVLKATDDQLKQAGLTSAGNRRSGGPVTPRYGSSSNTGYGSNAPQPRVPFGLTSPEQLQSQPWVQQVQSEFGLSANTRAGHQTTNRQEAGFAPNPQNLIRGIDWNGDPAKLEAFAQWAMQHPEQFEQLIYRSQSGTDYEIAGGKVVHGYYKDDLAGHTDHVHTRSSQSFGPDTTSGGGDMNGYTYDGPGQQNNPMYVRSSDTSGEQLGKDIVSGIGEIFGLGTLFKDPTQFGLFKIFKSIMGLGSGMNGDTGALNGSGNGGNPLQNMINMLGGLSQQPYGTTGSGSPTGAPTEFIPGMDAASGGGSLTDFLGGFISSAEDANKSKNVDASTHLTLGSTKADAKDVKQMWDSEHLPQVRTATLHGTPG